MTDQEVRDMATLLAMCAKQPKLKAEQAAIKEISARYRENIAATHERDMIAKGWKRQGNWWALHA